MSELKEKYKLATDKYLRYPNLNELNILSKKLKIIQETNEKNETTKNMSSPILLGFLNTEDKEEKEYKKSMSIYKRKEGVYKNTSEKFDNFSCRYAHQYSSLYYARLLHLRKKVYKAAKLKWSDMQTSLFLEKIRDSKIMEECVLIGTLYKEMRLKPSVLKEYLDNLDISHEEYSTNYDSHESNVCTDMYASEDDTLYLEDMTSRLALGGIMNNYVHQLVTGVIMAVKGVANEDGIFVVQDFCLAGFPTSSIPRWMSSATETNLGDMQEKQKKNDASEETEEQDYSQMMLHDEGKENKDIQNYSSNTFLSIRRKIDKKYIAFVSGLSIGSTLVNPLSLQLLRDFLLGALGRDEDKELSSQIVRLVVVGNSISEEKDYFKVLEEADTFFCEIAACLPVDLMPGNNDPTTYSLPQQRFHAALFKFSKCYDNFYCASNPYSFVLDNTRMLGSSGQPVNDICAFSKLDEIQALELTAQGRCIAPTAPDTLPCFPFSDDDPFCFSSDKHFPHIIFSGCHNELKYKYIYDSSNDDNTKKSSSTSIDFLKKVTIEKNEIQTQSTSIEAEDVDSCFNLNFYDGNHQEYEKRICLLLCLPNFFKESKLILVELTTLDVVQINFSSKFV